jgi:outer membrane receptor for ferrienterochelin and colicin
VYVKRVSLALLLIVLCAGGPALAQAGGALTGNIEGVVKVGDNPVPGVLVTISSPALQGKRSVATGTNGDFLFRQLPPGSYTISYALSGMKPAQRTFDLRLGDTSRQDATLEVATAAAAVTVSGASVAAEEAKVAVHGATFKGEDIQNLPVARNLAAIAANSPGLTTKTPNGGQLSISGAFAYDNKFMVNGVDINDNLFGQATDQVVIEEAVQETQVMTSNISAEYGGFSGGVVNAITKSGGNVYSGSARVDFANPNWTAYTPIQARNHTSIPSKLSEVYSATLGGKIIEDRLWFFAAGRYTDQTTSSTLPVTNTAIATTDKEPRFEGKLTGNINASHTLQFDYTNSSRKVGNRADFSFTGEATGDISPEFPANVLVASYNGVFTPNFIGSLLYSEKKFQFKNFGGTGSNIVSNSPFLSSVDGAQPFIHYNAPYFDATDPEDRNNKDLAGSLSYYLSAGKLGNHDLKVGFDIFHTIRSGGNSQSPTNYVFYTDYKTDANGNPLFAASPLGPSQLIPTFVPGTSQLLIYLASRGAQTDIRTDAFYFNDSFRIDHFAFNIGVRYEKVNGTGPGGSTITDTHAFVPRLGAIWDVKGNGQYQVSGSYAQYAGKYNDAQAGQGTVVGNPNGIYQVYTGPAGEGYGFAPGFDPKNYSTYGVNFPLANVFYPDSVSAPITTEYTLSVGGKLTPTFNAAATFIYRNTKNFIEDFINNPTASGKTDIVYQGVDYGTFDNKYFANSDVPRRKYEALQFQSGYSGIQNLFLQANYTYMLKFEGTFEGEATNQPGISSAYGNFPEVAAPDRNFPYGNLSGYQKHKLRLLGTYSVHSKLGIFTPGLIYAYDSGGTYSITSSLPYTAIQTARDPGYASLPASQTVFYDGRGGNFYPSQQRWDLSFAWDAPIYKTVAPYVRFAITNLFDTHYLVTYNTSVSPINSGPLDANGLPLTYKKGGNFGVATSSTNFQTPRVLTVAAGIRF